MEWDVPDKGNLGILTPYKNQVQLIRNGMKELWKSAEMFGWGEREREDLARIEVLTVHRAQGREWDTIFFSASDPGGRLAGNEPFYADTAILEGKLVVNTAISRSKRYLRFFFDIEFWENRNTPNLLSEIAQLRR